MSCIASRLEEIREKPGCRKAETLRKGPGRRPYRRLSAQDPMKARESPSLEQEGPLPELKEKPHRSAGVSRQIRRRKEGVR